MNAVSTRDSGAGRWLLMLCLCLAAPMALAQAPSSSTLPVAVSASGNHAAIVVGDPDEPLAEVSLDFEDATGLSPASLGASAQLVDPTSSALLARLPSATLSTLPLALPLMITIEPPAAGGLSFRNTGRLEIHTHALPYTVGSFFRVYKAPLGGAFEDVTDEIAQGSVRARTTYGGFSQFLILVDLRSTGTVIDQKVGWLRNRVAMLPLSERGAFTALLDQVDNAVDAGRYDDAIDSVDAIRARAQARSGQFLANEWRATRDVENHAGQLVAGANTLRFSVAYLRDFGQ